MGSLCVYVTIFEHLHRYLQLFRRTRAEEPFHLTQRYSRKALSASEPWVAWYNTTCSWIFIEPITQMQTLQYFTEYCLLSCFLMKLNVGLQIRWMALWCETRCGLNHRRKACFFSKFGLTKSRLIIKKLGLFCFPVSTTPSINVEKLWNALVTINLHIEIADYL